MRLDLVYLVGSVWIPTGPQVCPSSYHVMPNAEPEVTWSPVPKKTAEMTAFVDVNVIPMDTERVLTNQTVVIQKGLITALGPASQVQVPAGAVRIDGRGQYLMPGLADMHVHPTLRKIGGKTYDEFEASLVPHIADGITTIRYLNPVGDKAALFRKAESFGPHIYTPGFHISGRGKARSSLGGEVERPDSVAAYLAEAKAAGYDWVRVDPSAVHKRATLPIVDSVLVAARRLGMPIATHVHDSPFDEVLALGSFNGAYEHLYAFWQTLGFSSGYHGHDTLDQREVEQGLAKIPVLAAAAQGAGVWIIPTLYCIESKYMPTPSKVTILRRLVKAFQDAGVGLFLAGDDGKGVHDELAALVRAGLTPYQALLTGTRNVAKYFGILDSGGTVAVGKRADLVLLYGNPLEDIRYTREPAGVMLHGHWLDRAELDQRLITVTVKPGGRPLSWLRLGALNGRIVPSPYKGRHGPPEHLREQYEKAQSRVTKFRTHIDRFEALADSLEVAKSLGLEGKSVHERLLALQADELSAMRSLLPPERHETFDPVIRVWLREQARRGYQVAVPGVTPLP